MTKTPMEDLNEKLTRLLSSPDGMEKIRSAMAALSGMSAGAPPSDRPDPPIPTASAVPATPAAPAAPNAAPVPPAGGAVGGDTALIGKLLPLIGSYGQENEDTRLLRALRPYLHGEREERLEDAIRLLKLTHLLPLLRQSIPGGTPGGSSGGSSGGTPGQANRKEG